MTRWMVLAGLLACSSAAGDEPESTPNPATPSTTPPIGDPSFPQEQTSPPTRPACAALASLFTSFCDGVSDCAVTRLVTFNCPITPTAEIVRGVLPAVAMRTGSFDSGRRPLVTVIARTETTNVTLVRDIPVAHGAAHVAEVGGRYLALTGFTGSGTDSPWNALDVTGGDPVAIPGTELAAEPTDFVTTQSGTLHAFGVRYSLVGDGSADIARATRTPAGVWTGKYETRARVRFAKLVPNAADGAPVLVVLRDGKVSVERASAAAVTLVGTLGAASIAGPIVEDAAKGKATYLRQTAIVDAADSLVETELAIPPPPCDDVFSTKTTREECSAVPNCVVDSKTPQSVGLARSGRRVFAAYLLRDQVTTSATEWSCDALEQNCSCGWKVKSSSSEGGRIVIRERDASRKFVEKTSVTVALDALTQNVELDFHARGSELDLLWRGINWLTLDATKIP